MAKFGIPEEYVREAFAEETLLKAAVSGESTFYVALEDRCKILGFAQTIERESEVAELDRIVVFPEHVRKGIGTKLLARVVNDERKKGTKTIIANAGKEEAHTRRFYEKNGFKQVRETVADLPDGNHLALVVYQALFRAIEVMTNGATLNGKMLLTRLSCG